MNEIKPLCGAFPKRRNTVTAEVLSRLIRCQDLRGMDAVVAANTTRLAAVIHQLRRLYGWVIESLEETVPTKDGRTTEISVYRLPAAVIEAAMSGGAEEFCATVYRARELLRQGAKSGLLA